MIKIFKDKQYLRSVFFGIEDSLVSTTGLVAGISIGSNNNQFVLLAGFVAVIIEAVSMGTGEYLSDDTIEELDKLKRHRGNPLYSGLLMLSAYFLAGMVPLLPIVLLKFPTSLITSTLLALACLFGLGFVKGRILKISPYKSGIKILLVGGVTTVLGVVVGLLFKY